MVTQKKVYLDKVDGYATGFQQAVSMIEEEYNSVVRQTRVKNYLSSLRISSFTSDGTEESAALAKVYKVILKFSRQCPRSHQGDAHKVESLRNAVVGSSWSHEPLSRVATHCLTFQQLYGELEAALQFNKEAKVAKLRDSAENRGKLASQTENGSIFYTGQGRYTRDRRPLRASTAPGRSAFDPLSIQGCFNCGGTHILKDCKLPPNNAKAAANRIEYYQKKANLKGDAVHQVLVDICYQLDETTGPAVNPIDEDERQVFETLFKDKLAVKDGPVNGSDTEEKAVEDGENIFVVNESSVVPDNLPFLGACVDSAAQKTVIGELQAKAYCEFMNIPFAPNTSSTGTVFRFGTHRHKGLGKLEIRIPITDFHFLELSVDIVGINVPFFFGLDMLKAFKMVIDAEHFILSSRLQGWEVQLTEKLGHLYYEWGAAVMFTEAELQKTHRHFFHPQSERLYAVMKRADPETTSPTVLSDLERIAATCDICQRAAQKPHRFRVSLPEGDIVFNRTVCLDLMFLDSKTVLHIVDKDTKFSAAAFLGRETAEAVWEVYMRIWTNKYIGFSDVMSADQGPQFRSIAWKNFFNMAGMKLELSGVESHNALGVGERYHSFLRQIYRKVRAQHPEIPTEYALSLAVKAMNDSAGPKGLVPTLLVFGVMPRIPIVPMALPVQVQRMKAMLKARDEMTTIIAGSQMKKALRSNAPGAAMADIPIGSEVLVYKEKPIDKWVGPHKVLDINGKMLHVEINGRATLLSIDKVKHLRRPDIQHRTPQSLQVPERNLETDEDIVGELRHITSQMRVNELEPPSLIDGAPPSDPLSADDNISAREFVSVVQVNLTEVVHNDDPRLNSLPFKEAKEKEISGLVKRQTWRVIKKSDLPPSANVLSGRFVLTMKNLGTDHERVKARYVAQGHKDKEN